MRFYFAKRKTITTLILFSFLFSHQAYSSKALADNRPA